MITYTGLFLSIVFVAIAFGISLTNKLRLERDVIEAMIRAFIQLMLVGYVLKFVFGQDKLVFTLSMILVMVFVGTFESTRRSKGIPKPMPLMLLAMFATTLISMGLMVALGIISFKPIHLIPISGMVIGNSMRVLSQSAIRFQEGINDKRETIEASLALGMSPWDATQLIRKKTLRLALIPRLDGVKITGIVHLPGVMVGMILAGASPIEAVKFQIVIMYLLTGAPFIAAWIFSKTVYSKFFNSDEQLVLP